MVGAKSSIEGVFLISVVSFRGVSPGTHKRGTQLFRAEMSTRAPCERIDANAGGSVSAASEGDGLDELLPLADVAGEILTRLASLFPI